LAENDKQKKVKYVNSKEHKLAGFTLTINRFAPTSIFYRKNVFVDYDYVLYMGKEVI
jgi:hypothetical protein